MALAELLETRLGRRVELVTTEALSPFIGPRIRRKRRMSFEPRDNLLHIIAEADFLLHESHGLTSDEFQTNEILRRAFVRSLGEATKRLPREYRAQHPSIEWHRIARRAIA